MSQVRTFLEEVYQQSLVEASSGALNSGVHSSPHQHLTHNCFTAPSQPPAADPNDNPDEASEGAAGPSCLDTEKASP